MSFRTARDKVAAILEQDATPTASGFVSGPFRFVSTMDTDADVTADSRAFSLRLRDGNAIGAHYANIERKICLLDLQVYYKPFADLAEQDAAIGGDYSAIVTALADSSNWDTSTSTIEALGSAASDIIFPYNVDELPNGGRLLSVDVLVRYRET